MPLAKNNVRSVAGSLALGPVCPNGRNIYQCCSRIEPTEAVNVVLQDAKILRPALADDQVGGCNSIAARWSILGGKAGLGRIATANGADGRLVVVAIDSQGHPDLAEGESIDLHPNGPTTLPAARVEVLKIDSQGQTVTVRLIGSPH